jgi:hypothetical protein
VRRGPRARGGRAQFFDSVEDGIAAHRAHLGESMAAKCPPHASAIVSPNGRRSIRVFRTADSISRSDHPSRETAASGTGHANARTDLSGRLTSGHRVARLGHYRPDALADRVRRAPAVHQRATGRRCGLQPRIRPGHAQRYTPISTSPGPPTRCPRSTRSRHIRHPAYRRGRGGRVRDLDLHTRRKRAIGQRVAPVGARARHRARDGPRAGRFGTASTSVTG